MATLLHRLGTAAFRRWPVVVAAWLLVVIGAGTLAATVSKPMEDTFTIPGIPALQAQELQQYLFPEAEDAQDLATVNVVVAAPEGGSLREQPYSGEVETLVAALQDLPQMPSDPPLTDPVTASDAQFEQAVSGAVEAGTPKRVAEENARALLPLGEDDRIGVITWNFDVASPADVEPATREALLDALQDARDDGLTAEVNGSGLQAIPEVGGTSELVGIAVAAVVLIITFGSLVAAGLPILTALIGVALGILGISIATALHHHRHHDPDPGHDDRPGRRHRLHAVHPGPLPHRAAPHRRPARGRRRRGRHGRLGRRLRGPHRPDRARRAERSSGIPFLTSMGLAAAGTVFLAVLVALTLLPALLGMLGSKAFAGRVRRREDARDDDGLAVNNGVRWARLVGRAPIVVVLLVVVGLGALAAPLQSLQLSLPTDSTSAVDTTQRKASDLVSEAFGPGREAPLLVVVDARRTPGGQSAQQAFGDVVAWASGQDGVAEAQVVATTGDGLGAQVLVTPRADRRTRPPWTSWSGCAPTSRRSRTRPARTWASPASPRSRPTSPSG